MGGLLPHTYQNASCPGLSTCLACGRGFTNGFRMHMSSRARGGEEHLLWGTASRHMAASSRTFSEQLPINAQARARCQGQAGMDSVHETQNCWLVEGRVPPAGPGRELSASRNAIRVCWNAPWAQMGQRGTGQRGPGCPQPGKEWAASRDHWEAATLASCQARMAQAF